MNIANQGFPATRADLNNALQALASNNSGTSAPSTTFANQWWYDEANNQLYIRNEANNAWIQVAVLDQTNNEWQITTGVIQAKDGDGLALKTDDGTTRLFIKDSDGSIQFSDDVELVQAKKISFKHQAGGTTRAAISADSSDNLTFGTGSSGTEKLRIQTDGALLVKPNGITTGLRLHGRSSDNGFFQQFKSNDGSTTYATIGTAGASELQFQSDTHQFYNAASNVHLMQVKEGSANGSRVSIGNTAVSRRLDVRSGGITTAGFFYQDTSDVVLMQTSHARATGGNNATYIQFQNAAGVEKGTIKVTTSATSYNTSSDYRLKENVTYDVDGITRLKKLKPARFNWIEDETNTLVDGFLAHEASDAVPESVFNDKDETKTVTNAVLNSHGNVIEEDVSEADWTAGKIEQRDDDGNVLQEAAYAADTSWTASKEVPVYQTIDHSKLVPLLTAALQEALVKIEALESRVTALEG